MRHASISLAVAALALASLACTITIPFPVTEIKTGPTQTRPIQVPAAADAKTVT